MSCYVIILYNNSYDDAISKFLPICGFKWANSKEIDSNKYYDKYIWFRWKQYFEEEDCRCWQKIPITSGLFKKTEYTEIEKKIHNVTGLVTNVAVNTKSI